jgi:hypothetical protein
MLDPLTALSLAGNIIQFVDFACKLFSKGWEIYDSAAGLSVGDQQLETIANDLRDISNRFKDPIQSHLNICSDQLEPRQKTDTKLIEMSTQCTSVANELIRALEELRLSDLNHKNRRWKSARHAFKSLWKKEKICAIVDQLQTLRAEWNFHILVSLRWVLSRTFVPLQKM